MRDYKSGVSWAVVLPCADGRTWLCHGHHCNFVLLIIRFCPWQVDVHDMCSSTCCPENREGHDEDEGHESPQSQLGQLKDQPVCVVDLEAHRANK